MIVNETPHALGAFGVTWFENRNIDAETAVNYGVFTGKRIDREGNVAPDPKGNVIVFQTWERGVVVAEKYRSDPRVFWQKPGARKTFYNSDILDDPALQDARNALVITEGEPDMLAVADCGYRYVVSVPDGAPSVPKGKAPTELDPLDPKLEAEGKFEYMWINRERLRKIKRFVIAVDSDEPGQRLGAELVRRLSAAKCSFVEYPPDLKVPTDDTKKWPSGVRPCKDLNEVLLYFDAARVIQIISDAKPYPVRGIYRLSDYRERQIVTYTVGWPAYRNRLRVQLGEFMVVTGIPSSGKSTWTMNLVANLCSTHGWRAAVCSPEMPTLPHMRDFLRRWSLLRKPLPTEVVDIKRADDWINNRFVFIDTDPLSDGGSDEPFNLDWIIDRATDAVLRDGIRILVIDPWNELDHAREKGESGPDYIGRSIRMLKRFAKLYEVMVIVVAHPTKDVGGDKKGVIRKVTLYDIEGAAHWYNKCDHGIVIERNRETGVTEVWVEKVRYEGGEKDNGAGTVGKVDVYYSRETGHFDEDPPQTKSSNKLSKSDTAALAER